MKLISSEGCEEALILSSGAVHHLSPPASLPPPPFKGDDLEEDDPMVFSPARKSLMKSDLASRLHCIPVLMVLVFFVLWAASSEVKPAYDHQIMAITSTMVDKSAGVHGLKVTSNEINALPGRSRTVLFEDETLHSNHGDSALRNRNALPQRSYIRGNARSDAR